MCACDSVIMEIELNENCRWMMFLSVSFHNGFVDTLINAFLRIVWKLSVLILRCSNLFNVSYVDFKKGYLLLQFLYLIY